MNVFAVVIGGGPAGAAVALTLTKAGHTVVLIERQTVSGWKIGETLPPQAQAVLQSLGLWEQFLRDQHLPCYGTVSAWGQAEPFEQDFIFDPNGHGWQLDRSRFESSLLAAVAENGCHVLMGEAVLELAIAEHGWLVSTSTGTIETKWIVDSTGRNTHFLPDQRGDYHALDQLASVFVIAKSQLAKDHDARTYVESHPQGWCYTALTPSGRRTIAFQTDHDLLTGAVDSNWLWARIQECPTIASLLSEHQYKFDMQPCSMSARSGRHRHTAGHNWVAVGDAAMAFDPLCGQGSFKALASAQAACDYILTGTDYGQLCEDHWQRYVAERQATYGLESRWCEQPFWKRRLPESALL